MTMVSIGDVLPFPAFDSNMASTGSTFAFDGATDLLAVVFHIPVTGTIDKVHYRINAIASPLLTLRTQLRTVDATTGFPNAAGTMYGSSTSIAVTNPTAGLKTAAVAATATAGDLVALTFDLSAFTSGSATLLTRMFGNVNQTAQIFPYQVANSTGATAVAVDAFNVFALEYSGAVFYPLQYQCYIGAASATVTVTNSGVTRRGNRIRSAVPRRAVGIWAGLNTTVDTLLRLRKQSDDSVLATVTVDKDVRGAAALGMHFMMFDTGATVTLAAGTDYYVLIEGQSASTAGIQNFTGAPSNATLGQLSGGINCYGTSFNSTYTDDNVGRYAIGVLYDQLDDGTSTATGMPASRIFTGM